MWYIQKKKIYWLSLYPKCYHFSLSKIVWLKMKRKSFHLISLYLNYDFSIIYHVYNHIFTSFWIFLKFHFLTKYCILEAFDRDSVTEGLTQVYLRIYSYLTKISFPGNKTLNPGNETFKNYLTLDKGCFIYHS